MHLSRFNLGGSATIMVLLSEQSTYFGRHGYASQNVMAACDFDMRFTFVVTGWPGSLFMIIVYCWIFWKHTTNNFHIP